MSYGLIYCNKGGQIDDVQKILNEHRPLHYSRKVTDKDTPHGVPPFCIPHTTPLSQGSPNVFVNGLPLGRLGDAFSCGIKVASGSPNVITNG